MPKGIQGFQKGNKPSKAIRKKMSESRLKRKQELGFLNSTKTRIKMSLAKQNISEETRRKLSENSKINPNYGMKGKYHTEKTKEKIRIARVKQIIKPHSEEAKRKIGLKKKGQCCLEEVKKKISETKIKFIKEHPEVIERLKEQRAKQIFPIKDTSIEIKIQNFLRKLGIEFFTHQHLNIKHSYQCDILIPSMNLVIECDGNYWHKYPVGLDIDHTRTKELIKKGFKVLRLWEFEINEISIKEFKKRLRSLNA